MPAEDAEMMEAEGLLAAVESQSLGELHGAQPPPLPLPPLPRADHHQLVEASQRLKRKEAPAQHDLALIVQSEVAKAVAESIALALSPSVLQQALAAVTGPLSTRMAALEHNTNKLNKEVDHIRSNLATKEDIEELRKQIREVATAKPSSASSSSASAPSPWETWKPENLHAVPPPRGTGGMGRRDAAPREELVRDNVVIIGGFKENSKSTIIEPMALAFLQEIGGAGTTPNGFVSLRAPFTRSNRVIAEFVGEMEAKDVLKAWWDARATWKQERPGQEFTWRGLNLRMQPERPREIRMMNGMLYKAGALLKKLRPDAPGGSIEESYGNYKLVADDVTVASIPRATPPAQPVLKWHWEAVNRLYGEEFSARLRGEVDAEAMAE